MVIMKKKKPDRDRFRILLPLVASLLSLAIASVSLYVSFQGHELSKEEFFATRTTILTSALRPQINGKQLLELGTSEREEDKQEFRQIWENGFKSGFIAFMPSLKPSDIRECKLIFPREVTDNGSHDFIMTGNLSTGAITRLLVSEGVIDDGDFAIPSQLLVPKFYDFLQRITPEQHKIGHGTLNEVVLPLVIEIDFFAKGRQYTEQQLYDLRLIYQVSEEDECLVQTFLIDFKRRLDKSENVDNILDYGMKNMRTLFSAPTTSWPNLDPHADAASRVIGRLKPWKNEFSVDGRRIVLAKLVGDQRGILADCVLTNLTTTSDTEGNFQFEEVPPGKYFVLYDSGLSDFNVGLNHWTGKTLRLEDPDWLYHYFVDQVDDEILIVIPEGTLRSAEEYVTVQMLRVLVGGRSPFVLAHDIGKLLSGKALDPVTISVSGEQVTHIEFQVHKRFLNRENR